MYHTTLPREQEAEKMAMVMALKGVLLDEYAREHKELYTAIKAWKKGPIATLLK